MHSQLWKMSDSGAYKLAGHFGSFPTTWIRLPESQYVLSDRPDGVMHQDGNNRIWVKTWSEILNDCKYRLQLFQKELNYSADRDASLGYLRETYAKALQGNVQDQAEGGSTETENSSANPPQV